MLEAYGAWGKKSMYGRNFMGIIRTTVLVGPDGRIARIWPKVKVDGHAAEVLGRRAGALNAPSSPRGYDPADLARAKFAEN